MRLASLPYLQVTISGLENGRYGWISNRRSTASRTSVGGYTEEIRPTDTEQFDVSDQRTLDEVIRWLMECEHIPSFCTACYRAGRTGDRFMSFCKSGQILNYCHPNALMTLSEFLTDYASPETQEIGWKMVESELANIPDENRRGEAGRIGHRLQTGLLELRLYKRQSTDCKTVPYYQFGVSPCHCSSAGRRKPSGVHGLARPSNQNREACLFVCKRWKALEIDDGKTAAKMVLEEIRA